MRRYKKRKRRNRAPLFLCIFLALVIVAAMAVLGYGRYQEKKAAEERQAKLDAVYLNNPDMPKEYRELAAENPDVYAWLEIPGTEISYPILQNENDNSYYLSHDETKQESEKGAIFSENSNKKDFSDRLTVIYGNRMEDGSMFGGLLEYEDPMYYEGHREIKIYTPDSTLTYQIFATYVGDNSHLLLSRDLTKDENFESYINEIFEQRGLRVNLDKTVQVGLDSKILALSTGHPSDQNARYILQAVLIQRLEM